MIDDVSVNVLIIRIRFYGRPPFDTLYRFMVVGNCRGKLSKNVSIVNGALPRQVGFESATLIVFSGRLNCSHRIVLDFKYVETKKLEA
jgi:hypothetical protein